MRGQTILTAALLLGTASGALAQTDGARAELRDREGDVIGTAALAETHAGVLISVTLAGAPAGTHAFHVHRTGACQPAFTAAGGHYNPLARNHGFHDRDGAHGGDLPNIHVPASGDLSFEVLAADLTLEAGRLNSVFDEDGSALVIHARGDDYRSQPAGDAGDRIACGVIER